MKGFQTICICFAFTVAAFSQTFISKGKYVIKTGEEILDQKFLDDRQTLLLVGRENAVFWDIENRKILKEIPYENHSQFNSVEVDSGGRKVFSLSGYLQGKTLKSADTGVYDLQTGKKLKTFNKWITRAFWSENGKTLVTYDNNPSYYGVRVEVSFWDGESFEHRNSIVFDSFYRGYLSNDGERFYTFSKNKEKVETVDIWNTKTGKLENTLINKNNEYILGIGPLSSYTGKFLGVVAAKRQNKKDKTLFLWEMNGSTTPKYIFDTNPKITDSYFHISLDDKSVALDTGKNLEIYDIESARKLAEIYNSRLPDYWLADNRIFLYDGMKGFSVSTGKLAYKEALANETVNVPSFNDTTETVVLNSTAIVPSPDTKLFLTYSNQLLKIYTAEDGKIVDMPIRPPLEKKPPPLSKAGWSKDGKYIFARRMEADTLLVWSMKN